MSKAMLVLFSLMAAAGGVSVADVTLETPVVREMLDRTAGELARRALLNVAREHLGEVEAIVRDRETGAVYAQVEVDGEHAVVGLDRVYPRGNSLVLFSPVGKEQLLAEKFDPERHEVVDENTRIGDLDGVASAPQPPVITFSELDRDGDGAVTREEARGYPPVANRWGTIDTDGDGRIDRAEFSAFEDALPDVPEV